MRDDLSEAGRLRALYALDVLDTSAEKEFDALVQAAALVCDVPISLISLIDTNRQWFKANVGLPGVTQTPRDIAFCTHAIESEGILEVSDATQDSRFAYNPLVMEEPHIRFYAGATLRLSNGAHVGTLCVIDRQAKQLTEQQRTILQHLASAAVFALEARRALLNESVLRAAAEQAAAVVRHSMDAIVVLSLDGSITHWNRAAERLFGYTAQEMLGQPVLSIMPATFLSEPNDWESFVRDNADGRFYETQRLHRSGELISVAISVAPIMNEHGQLTGFTKIIRDIRQQVQAAQALEASEARFKGFSDNLPVGVFAMNHMHGPCVYANQSMQDIFGLTHKYLMNQGWLLSVDSADRGILLDRLQYVAEVGDELASEVTIHCAKTGQARAVMVRVRCVPQVGDGDAVGWIGSVADVTHQRQMVTQLASSEAQHRLLYQQTPAMMHSVDAQGLVVHVSNQWLETLGYAQNAVLGRTCTDFFAETSKNAMRELLQESAAGGTDHCDDMALQMVHRDGHVLDVLLSVQLQRSPQGKLLHGFALIENVTQRRHDEQVLAEQRFRLEAVILGTDAGSWEWNVATGVTRFNERWAAIVGYTLPELGVTTIQTWLDLVHPEDAPVSQAQLQQYFEGLTTHYECEVRMRHRDGHWVWVLDRGRVCTWTDAREPEWMFGSHLDITLRKQQEVILQRSEAFLARIGDVSGVGGWELDLISSELTWSAQTRKIHGVDAHYRPSLEHAIEFYAPEGRPLIMAAVQHAIATGESWDLELPFIPACGPRLWVRTVGQVVKCGEQVVQLMGTFQDITAQVTQREALRAVQERMVLAADSGGIGVWELHLPTLSLEWDRWMHRIYGLESAPQPPSYDQWSDCMQSDDGQAFKRLVEQAMRGEVTRIDMDCRVVRDPANVCHLRMTAQVKCDSLGQPVRMVGVSWDVTSVRRLTDELARQHGLLQVTLESIGDAVITTDAQGVVTWLNPVAEQLTGWSSEQATGQLIDHVFHAVYDDRPELVQTPVGDCLAKGLVSGAGAQVMLLSRSGKEFAVQDTAAPIRDSQGDILGAVLVFHDVTEQRRLNGEMSFRATHDSLTGLFNRAELDIRLQKVLETARLEQTENVLLFIDLDQFKLVNDACGHSAGDDLLRQVTQIMLDIVSRRDTLARLGGDEFAVLLEKCSAAQALRVAQKICDDINEFRFVHDDRRFRVGASIGLVPFDQRWESVEAARKAADTACYAAKEAGRNRVHTWVETDKDIQSRHGEMHWASRLEQAMDDDHFVLFAQRIYPSHGRDAFLHAEVLLRMMDGQGGLIPPGAFLPAAERFHLSSRLDRWVLRNTLDFLAAQPDLSFVDTICVNLSGQSVGDKAFHRYAIELLRRAGVDVCERLCFEVTETAAITRISDASVFIDQIRAMGAQVALDDFGAGASSFGYLKSLSVNVLKIDGQFVKNIIEDTLDDATVRCFVDVANVVGMKTVAEFVDNQAVLERLRVTRVDFVQGYLLHKPEPIAQVFTAASEEHRQRQMLDPDTCV